MSDGSAFISLSAIEKRFGSLTVLKDITFDIGKGEFFSLLGASGCGKTTLLRILSGIEQPSAGTLLIDGQSMAGVPANKRPTNMVFQSYAIFPHLNVEENIGYGLRNVRIAKDEARQRVQEALELVKLNGLGTRNAHQLSGGQRQRVALARALVCRPKVLLLDEPLSALDKKLREEMQLELRALQRTVGITFVFVTHDQEEALTLSDRIAVMANGRVLQLDTPQGLYERPRSREVAEFIGTMNLLPGAVSQSDQSETMLDAGLVGTLGGRPIEVILDKGARAYLAVRPEQISLSATEPSDPARYSVAGEVAEAAYLGDRIHYQVRLTGLEKPMTVFVNNTERAVVRPLGSNVWLSWDRSVGLVLPG